MADNLIRNAQTEGFLTGVSTDASFSGDGTPGNPLSLVGGGGGSIVSVNGDTGPVVVLTTDDISQGVTNLYNQTHTGDVTGSVSLTIADGAVTQSKLATDAVRTAKIADSQVTDAKLATGINANKISGGSVSNTEFDYLDGVTSSIQTQLTARIPYTETSTASMQFVIDEDNMSSNSATKVPTQQSVKAYADNGFVALTGNQSVAGIKTFSSIPVGPSSDPTTGDQLTRKAYVDSLVVGLIVHAPCRVATTTNGTLATSFENGDTIDGITLVTGDRILIKDQTTERQNGVYVVAASGAPSRATDYDQASEMLQGTSFYVSSGTINATRTFVQSSPNVVTVDTDPITFAQVGSATNFRFFVGSTGTDFNVVENGLDITYHLPTASATNRGALSTSDWSTFNAKASISGTPTTGRLASWTSATTVQDSGVSLTISGGSTSSLTIPTTGTVATLAGAESLTNKKLGSLTTNGFVKTGSGDGTLSVSTTVNVATEVTGVLPVVNGGFNEVDVQTFTADGTWTKPTTGTPKLVLVLLIGGGGGGGSGRRGASGTIRVGGGGGGPGGMSAGFFVPSTLGSTETIIVGTGGAGGAARSTDNQNGATGTNGGTSFFGGRLRAGGGTGGGGGTATASVGGPGGQVFYLTQAANAGSGASGSGSGGAGLSPSNSGWSPSGGGSGGGVSTGNAASAGGAGGSIGTTAEGVSSGYATLTNGGSGGAINTTGSNGNSVTANSWLGGTGGGGGGSSITTNAGAGGNGGTYGAGGGGGGASVNATGNSGAGGAGADGLAVVITYF